MRRAFALAIVLWISAVLMSVAVFLLALFRQGVGDATVIEKKLQTQMAVESTMEVVKYLLATRKLHDLYLEPELTGWPEKLRFDGALNYIVAFECNVTIVFHPTGDHIDIYTTDGHLLERLVRRIINKDKGLNYADPFDDWIDQDDYPRPGGAESGYYAVKNVAYSVANRGMIQHPEELFLIKNFMKIPKSMRNRIIKRFHYGLSNIFNLSRIDPESASNFLDLAGFERIQLETLYHNDIKGYLKYLQQLFRNQYPNDERFTSYTSRHYVLDITAVREEARSAITVEIEWFTGNRYAPWRLYRYALKPATGIILSSNNSEQSNR